MKTLTGLNNNISSFENKKLKNLTKITGGLKSIACVAETQQSANTCDSRTSYDDGTTKMLTMTFG